MPHFFASWLLPALCMITTPHAGIGNGAASVTALTPMATAAVSMMAPAFDGSLLESQEGRFTLRFPEGFTPPDSSTMPLETAVGKLDMKVFTSLSGMTSVFMTAYVDYPDEAFAAGPEAMLDGAREGALKNLNGKLESQKNVTLLGHPGRTMTFSGKVQGKKMYGRVDYFLVKPRLYQVLYLTDKKANVASKDIKDAFSSFSLVNTPAASRPRN